jgi:hypothetical protein
LCIAPAYWFILLFISFVLGSASVRNGTHLFTGWLDDPLRHRPPALEPASR